ncbi:putative nucleotidyltransferase substrate binding domain-containing protein [Arcobacter sp. FWKO B]|uniref:putative nucleotidyltransferase substrate binding domain-containing protein n=1 Tax=Arcobacter sp. FWKO B TaxID=2593672 RepID=UPI0018A34EDE|nr:putative nucleotidyltransferase substrate binding domain-containing protein [Arcobacter sp. FWKO B]QOG11644.1 cyclic nucleotide-binding domain-containing protein [Arcobacter sp. FWKO B]
MSLLEQQTFIKGITPFDNLTNLELDEVSKKLDIHYFQKDQFIINESTVEQNLYFVIKGTLQEIDSKTSEVLSVVTAKEFFDPISLIEHRTKNYFKAVEECLLYVLPKEVFLKIVYQNPKLEHFFFQSISQKLSQTNANNQNKELASFMVARVKDAYLQKPLYVDENETIFNTVKFMKSHNLTSILIKNGDGEFGIATDTDFREKVILKRLDFDSSVKQISTFGLKSVDEDDFLFNAQLLMTKYGIKRLIAKNKDGQISGILDQMSLTSFFSSHTYAVANEIDNATTLEELKHASNNFIRIIKSLYAKGVKVRYISKLLNELNIKLFEKIFILLAPNELMEYSALIVLGSEGRSEQILRTDQDNALIIADNCPVSDDEIEKFCTEFTKTLCDFGYPECPGNIMVSNIYWRRRTSDFKELISKWINRKNEDDFMNLAIFIDANCVVGNKQLIDDLKEYVYNKVDRSAVFFTTFASFALLFATPLGIFNDFIVEKKDKMSELDLKKGGIFPIVHGIRALSLEYHIKETNTIDRIKELNNKGVIDKESASEYIEAFNFLLTLRLKTRLTKLDMGQIANNSINPSELSTMDKDMLKDTFKIVNKFKKFLTYHYKLNYV